MIRTANQRSAAMLAAVAAFGLVVAPLAHAGLHVHEASRTREQALAVVFRLAFHPSRNASQDQALGDALEEAFNSTRGQRPHQHGPGGHSHGGSGPHGSSAQEHFKLALHGPPPPAAALPPSPVPRAPLFAQLKIFSTPRYSTPEHSQAPPAA